MSPSPSSPFARIAAVLCASLALAPVAGCGGAPPPAAAPVVGGGLIGAAAPEIAAEIVSGEGPSTLGEARGKVVIVDFWATYCHPCRKSFPAYQKIVDRFGADVAVIAVALDAPEDVSKEQLIAFADEAEVTFRILWDKDESAVKKYKPPRMPTAYVIDRSGVVRHVHAGYEDGEEAKISREIEALLAEAGSPPSAAPPAGASSPAAPPAEAPSPPAAPPPAAPQTGTGDDARPSP
ncbi:TlpA family protein disulfide reductase [Sorangium sp. So ce854]|uniref:TlpA family protein disulfide reductase n=1 Tax=Sorangium sp. So ce854 TaxID=3133322 RepID=UPI003F5D7311